jgi:hypothetical protein
MWSTSRITYETEDQMDSFMRALTEISEGIGLLAKPKETWVSSVFLIYGKEMLLRGAYMPQATKHISRLLTDVNKVYSTIQTKTSSLYTARMATCQKSHSVVLPYLSSATDILVTVRKDMADISRLTIQDWEIRELCKSTQFLTLFLLCSDVGEFSAL